jgi:glycine/D-amino acid oxidase-like deaminating enzyme
MNGMVSGDSVLTPDFKTTPYWWEESPRPPAAPDPLPAQADVVVVGSGYTGLSASLTLLQAGRQVLVLDAENLGAGASSRNTGSMGRTFRHNFSELAETRGIDFATRVYREVHGAFDFAYSRIESEGIKCHLARRGRFTAFIGPTQYDESARELELRQKYVFGQDYMVPREAQRQEIGFGNYFGGIVIPDVASIHPGLYQLGLLSCVKAAGGNAIGGTQVLNIIHEGKEFAVVTLRGSVKARDVIVATNGYTGGLMRYLQRRVFPFPAYIMATEPIGEERIKRLLPTLRVFQEKAENPFFLRPSPDLTRLVVGGRAGTIVTSLTRFAKTLHRLLAARIPDLAATRISHLWTGKCSGTFSIFPGIGVHDGVHYAMGYCFAGISMGTYLGHKIGLRVAGKPEAATVFDNIEFETRFWHQGYPWFVPFAAEMMLAQDRKVSQGFPI